MSDTEDQITDEEKATIVHGFINHAPPGEVDDVIRDSRILLNDDNTFKDGIVEALSKYQQSQFMPVNVDDENSVLLTTHGYQDNGRFIDPSSGKSFRYDFSKKSCVDIEDGGVDNGDAESWRKEIDTAIREYVKEYYPAGVSTVYGKSEDGNILITACIEDHKYSPENFWNGKWRSEWKVTISGNSATVAGVLKTQVHYYEDGNVQLVSQKECKDEITSVSNEKQLAESVRKLVEKFEHEYQSGVFDNYNNMSTTTFKALRRQLPVTRTKIDWNKILGYQIGKEIGGK